MRAEMQTWLRKTLFVDLPNTVMRQLPKLQALIVKLRVAGLANPAAILFALITLFVGWTIGSLSASANGFHHFTTGLPRPKTTEMVVPTSLVLFRGECNSEVMPPDTIRDEMISRLYGGKDPFDDFPAPHITEALSTSNFSNKGWSSTAPVFKKLLQEVQPRTILEVGTFTGASAVHMGKAATDMGLDTQIFCLDDFRGWFGFRSAFNVPVVHGDVYLLYTFMRNVVRNKLQSKILPIVGSTTQMDILCSWGFQADLIEVDAGHMFHDAWLDINFAHKLLSKKGVLFGHDYNTKRKGRFLVREAVNLFAALHHMNVEVMDNHWILRP